MSDREDLWVNGYCFGSLQDAKEARNESQTIAYFKEKTRGRTNCGVFDEMEPNAKFTNSPGKTFAF